MMPVWGSVDVCENPDKVFFTWPEMEAKVAFLDGDKNVQIIIIGHFVQEGHRHSHFHNSYAKFFSLSTVSHFNGLENIS